MGKRPLWWIYCASILFWATQAVVASEPEIRDDATPMPAAEATKSTAGPTVDGPVRQTPLPAYGDEVPEKPTDGEPQIPAGDAPASKRPNDHSPTTPGDQQADAAKPTESNTANKNATGEPARETGAPVIRELTPALSALRDRIRRTLATYRAQPLPVESNDVADVLGVCRAFGCRAEALRGGARVNAVTCLCWNFTCGGYEPLVLAEGRIAARIGYGRQLYPGQMLGVFALARVPANYPMRVGEDVRSVADLVEYEKRACRVEQEQSMRLLGLSFYTNDAPWKNSLGDEWSVERLVAIELSRPIVEAPEGGTMRLMALSAAVLDRARRQQPIDGHFARALKFTSDFQQFALELQGSDGSWSPNYFASRGSSRDAAAQLTSNGRIMEWLCFSLPDDRLAEPRMVRGIEYLLNLLAGQRYQAAALRSLNGRELASVMHALHALVLYDERMFGESQAAPAAAK